MKKTIKQFLCTTIAVLSLIVIAFPSSIVIAEDIDLFTGTAATVEKPNVLIILDNSANWNSNSQHWPGGIKQGEAELKAMGAVISALSDGVNVGLMMLAQGNGNHSSPSYQNTNGGYMRYAVRPMTAANKAAFLQLMGVNADGTTHNACVGLGPSATPPTVYIPVATAAPWSQPSGSTALTRGCILQFFSSNTEQVPTSGADWSGALFDAFKYFGGGTDQTIDNRLGLGPTRYGGNPDLKCDPSAYINGTTDADKRVYFPPISATNNCAKNYIIFIGNGFSATEPGEPANLAAVGGDTTILKMPQFNTNFVPSTTVLGTRTVCETNAACVTVATTTGAGGYDSYTCTGGTQPSVQTGTSSICETALTCQSTTAPTLFPGTGYTYSCAGGSGGGGVTTTIGTYSTGAVCATNATCATQAQATGSVAPFNLVAPFTCTGGSTSTIVDSGNTCLLLNNAANCTANAPAVLPGYGSYSCSGGSGVGCAGATRKNVTITGTCPVGQFKNGTQTMQGTTASACPLGQLINQTITATPPVVCTGSNFLNQTMNGIKSPGVAVVTPLGTEALPSPSNKNRYADEWTKFLLGTDVHGAAGKQNIKTYTIDVFKDAQDADATALLFNMAKVGGGKYFTAGSEDEIKRALQSIFIEIQAESSVFAAAALPVGATNRAQNANQVFFGSFRPDADAAPRWYGNLKRYQIVNDSNDKPFLADSNKVNAVSSATGFFGNCAVSFWTTDSGSYWSFSAAAAGTCTSVAGSTYSDLPDGAQVEKGGAAEVVRKGNNPPTTDTTPTNAVNRTMYTCASTAAGSCPIATGQGVVAFNTTNVSISALSAADATEQARIINYTKGQDVGQIGVQAGDENLNGSTTDTRPSIHGDVAHSRPLPVNYGGTGSYQSTGVVVYYGANDGPLRAVRANDGKELWSFVAPEHHGKLKRLMSNSPIILFPNQSAVTPAAQPKEYFFDGSMGLYQNADNSKIWMFATMRRGGRMIYGFDVTNPTAPVLKWRVGCPNLTDDTGCTTGFSGIGQTWSVPNVAFVKGWSGYNTTTKIPVIIVGGGYDSCWDADTATPSCGSNKGNKVFVINADTGALIKSFSTDSSVSGDVALVERNNDDSVDHGYVGDLSGNLYRIDFVAPSAPATLLSETATSPGWTITKIANVASGSSRRFLLGPAVLPRSDRVFVTIGSGDRERPLISNYPYTTASPTGVVNRFYTLMDAFPTSGGPIDLDGSTMADITSAPLTGTACLAPGSTNNGWRTNLAGGRGEQVVSGSLITGGTVFFNTNRPEPPGPGVCANLGEARGYNIELFCGTQFNAIYEGGGLPITPVTATTTACRADGSNCRDTTVVIGGASDPSQKSQFSPGKVVPVIAPRRSRLYWHGSANR